MRKRVAYVPTHAAGDINHPAVEYGFISSQSSSFVFVKFDKELEKFGWDGTTSKACRIEDLQFL